MVLAMSLLTLDQTPRVLVHRQYCSDLPCTFPSLAACIKKEWQMRLKFGEHEAVLQRRLLREVGVPPESVRGYFRIAGKHTVAWRAAAGISAAVILDSHEGHMLAQQVLELILHRMEECCRLISEPPGRGDEVSEAARLGTAALVINETLPCGLLRPLRDKVLMRDHRCLHNLLTNK